MANSIQEQIQELTNAVTALEQVVHQKTDKIAAWEANGPEPEFDGFGSLGAPDKRYAEAHIRKISVEQAEKIAAAATGTVVLEEFRNSVGELRGQVLYDADNVQFHFTDRNGLVIHTIDEVNGFVGIQNQNPQTFLHIGGDQQKLTALTGPDLGQVKIQTTASAGDLAALDFGTNGSNYNLPMARIAARYNVGDGSSLHFCTTTAYAAGVNNVVLEIDENGHITPGNDNTQNFGLGSKRLKEIFAGNNVINSSDERIKTFRADRYTPAEIAAAKRIQAELFGAYQMNEAIEIKGEDGARIHFGVGAQSVARIFEEEGLDSSKYSFWCYDEWDEVRENVQINRQKTRTETVTTLVNKKQPDGRYIQIAEETEQEVPVWAYVPVYDQMGEEVGKQRVPVMIMSDGSEVVDGAPEYESRITREAGSMYSIRYTTLNSFVLGAIGQA